MFILFKFAIVVVVVTVAAAVVVDVTVSESLFLLAMLNLVFPKQPQAGCCSADHDHVLLSLQDLVKQLNLLTYSYCSMNLT